MSLPEVRRAAGISYRESGRRDGPVLVLLHGIGSTSAGWRDQYAPLGERFRVVGWSAPGYHDSTPLPGEAPAAADYAKALARLLDALAVDQAALVTNSWGTLVALAFAALHGKRVRALVLGGPTVGSHGLSPAQRKERAAERIARVRGLGLQEMRVQDAPRLVSGSVPQPVMQWVIHGVPGEAPTPDGYCQAARMLYDTDGVELIRALAHPVLVVSGTEDVITPPEKNARLLAAAARCARFEAIDACGHLPHIEKPGVFNALVSDFLAAK